MPFTLEQLFSMGAQHTVESLVMAGKSTLEEATAALARRFGAEIYESGAAVFELRRAVGRAVTAGELLTIGRAPDEESFGVNAGLPEQYRYSVVAELDDPLEPGKTLSVPWKIDSPSPLSSASILARAESELKESMSDPNLVNRSGGTDLQNRKMRFASALSSALNPPSDEKPKAPDMTLSIIAAYRQSQPE